MNFALKIMATVLKTVLRKVDKLKKATNSYIEDILIDNSNYRRGHWNKFGLVAKVPESLEPVVMLWLELKIEWAKWCLVQHISLYVIINPPQRKVLA